jgi:YihY family inner membrane protein
MSREENRPLQTDSPSFLVRIGRVLWLTTCRYLETDGELRAASFAYYAFFALFPLILLFISIGSLFWDQAEVADQVIGLLQHIPAELNQQIVSTINGVMHSRGQAGLIAVLALVWSSLRFFQSLVRGVNRAWGTHEYSWWRLPLANLSMVAILGSALLLGVLAPVILKAVESYWQVIGVPGAGLLHRLFDWARLLLPSLILFYGILMFYKYAPRRKTRFREVWLAAAIVTAALQVVAKGFVVYAANFAKFNAIYGTLGSVVAVLMWIYLSGSTIIFGGCLCAAIAELHGGNRENIPPQGDETGC